MGSHGKVWSFEKWDQSKGKVIVMILLLKWRKKAPGDGWGRDLWPY